MRVGELSDRTGLPVGTIKFYLRAGVIPPGEHTSATQAQYGEEHVHRLRLVKAMSDVGGLTLTKIAEVLEAADNDALALHDTFGVAQDGMVDVEPERSPEWLAARADVDAMVARLKWRVRPVARSRNLLISAIVTLRQFGWPVDERFFDSLATWLADNAAAEIAFVDQSDRTKAIETSIVGTVAIEQAMAGLRRMALEHHSAVRNKVKVDMTRPPDPPAPRGARKPAKKLSPADPRLRVRKP